MSIREIFNNIINLINKLWSLIIDNPINFGYYFSLLAFLLALLILGFIGKKFIQYINDKLANFFTDKFKNRWIRRLLHFLSWLIIGIIFLWILVIFVQSNKFAILINSI